MPSGMSQVREQSMVQIALCWPQCLRYLTACQLPLLNAELQNQNEAGAEFLTVTFINKILRMLRS